MADLKSKGASATRQEVLNREWSAATGRGLPLELDEGLELVEIQNALRTTLSTAKTIEAFINAHAANLDDRPTFRQLFVDLAQDLVNGHALDLEGLVDILTLKDNRAESVNDGIIALNRLVRDSVSLLAPRNLRAHGRLCLKAGNRSHCYRLGGGYSFAMSEPPTIAARMKLTVQLE